MSTIRTAAAFAAVAAVAAFAVVPVAAAKSPHVETLGTCTKSSTAKLKLSNDDGRIEIEFEVDQNRNGIPWKVALSRNGALVASLTRTTRSPSGSFTVRRVVSNAAGANRLLAVGTSPSGERCTARAAL